MMDAAHKHDQARRQPQGILILIACPDAQHGCFDLKGVGLDQTWFMKITLSHAFLHMESRRTMNLTGTCKLSQITSNYMTEKVFLQQACV
jgi:hypothetical protein